MKVYKGALNLIGSSKKGKKRFIVGVDHPYNNTLEMLSGVWISLAEADAFSRRVGSRQEYRIRTVRFGLTYSILGSQFPLTRKQLFPMNLSKQCSWRV